jgi:hypothetical protein
VHRMPSGECIIQAAPDSLEPARRLSLKQAHLRLEFANEGGSVWGTAFTGQGGQVRIKGRLVRAIQTGRVLVASVGDDLEGLWNAGGLNQHNTKTEEERRSVRRSRGASRVRRAG